MVKITVSGSGESITLMYRTDKKIGCKCSFVYNMNSEEDAGFHSTIIEDRSEYNAVMKAVLEARKCLRQKKSKAVNLPDDLWEKYFNSKQLKLF